MLQHELLHTVLFSPKGNSFHWESWIWRELPRSLNPLPTCQHYLIPWQGPQKHQAVKHSNLLISLPPAPLPSLPFNQKQPTNLTSHQHTHYESLWRKTYAHQPAILSIVTSTPSHCDICQLPPINQYTDDKRSRSLSTNKRHPIAAIYLKWEKSWGMINRWTSMWTFKDDSWTVAAILYILVPFLQPSLEVNSVRCWGTKLYANKPTFLQ